MVGGRREGGREDKDRLLMRGWYQKGRSVSTHQYGCDVMAKDDNGDTLLHVAALGGSLSAVCTLIDEFKCDPNTKGFEDRIPLHSAANKGHIEIVRKLVRDHGCDVMSKDDNGTLLSTLLPWEGHCLQCAH